MVWKTTEAEFEKFQKTRRASRSSKNVGGQKITTYYGSPEDKEPPRHKERREQNREIREREKDKSAPLGWLEHKILGSTPITTRGRRTVGTARTKVGEVGSVVHKKMEPMIRAASPFVSDFRTIMGGPGNRGPIVSMPDPSFYGGFPYNQGHQKKKSGKKKRREPEESGGIWQGMMEVPEHARRWM